MSEGAAAAASLLVAALLGSVPSGWLLARAASGEDLRRSGSRSVGATNVLRRAGAAAGLATLVADVAKGIAAVAAARAIAPGGWVPAAGCVAAVFAHAWNPWLRFRGGRGVATAAGGMALLAPGSTAAAAGVFALALAGSRRVSVGSLAAAAALPVLVALQDEPRTTILAALASAAIVFVRHRGNLARLRAGTEPAVRIGGRRG